VNEFTDRMKNTLEEAKSALAKAKDDMARYYNQRRTPAPTYAPGDKVYLDASDIHTTRPSKKLSHRRLGPFLVEKRVGTNAYRLALPPSMKRLHPVFNIVKLTSAPTDPISAWRSGLETAKRPRLNRTKTDQDRKFPGPTKDHNRGPVCGPSQFLKFKDREKTGPTGLNQSLQLQRYANLRSEIYYFDLNFN